MATKIEWCQETWNPITGCTKISPGCANCYAERMAKRLAGRFGYPADEPFAVTLHESQFKKPLKWRKPRMVFVCSMGDLFHEDVPFEWIYAVVKAITRAHHRNPAHKWLFLTKRPQRVLDWREWSKTMPYTDAAQVAAWFQHMAWMGVTAENQAMYDLRWPILSQIPAAVRFVSGEPLLSAIDITKHEAKPDLFIVGGESGPGARPMHPEWARGLRDQCQAAGVPFFFKQWGEYAPIDLPDQPSDAVFRKGPGHDGAVWRVGKKKAGRLLDGREWNGYPEVNRCQH